MPLRKETGANGITTKILQAGAPGQHHRYQH